MDIKIIIDKNTYKIFELQDNVPTYSYEYDENNMPDSAVEAIQRARKNGHRVYVCTGRSKAEVYQQNKR